ncbi:MAG: hypothetical protein JWO46_1307 [Nocardioidaceae bacterium]|nr:hypothetical protein [Nocardioidaceae bacterium]
MAQLLLVRHGQASWGADDYDVLSETGWEQGRVLGRALAARGVAPTYAVRGTLRRHRETADAVGEGLLLPEVVVDAGWDEFDQDSLFGQVPVPWEGREPERGEFQVWFESVTERWTSGRADADYTETFTAFVERVTSALRRTADAAGSGTAIVLTSGGTISVVTAGLLGAELDDLGRGALWRRLNPVCANSGVTKVVVGGRGMTLVSFNEHTHLEQRPELLTYR